MAIFESIVALLRKNESFVLATILSRCGSAPRNVG
jgi:xanthine/CO dehydrogenase XdhC/CoxF family maturation factor